MKLRDFIGRIPAEYLAPGSHDLNQAVQFDITELAERIALGRPTVRLAEIYRQLPALFRRDFLLSDPTEIRFPWSKLLALVRSAERAEPKSGLSESGARHLAEKLRNQRQQESARPRATLHPPARKIENRRIEPPSRNDVPTFQARDPLYQKALTELESAIEGLASANRNGQPTRGAAAESARLRAELDKRTQEIEDLREELLALKRATEGQMAKLRRERDDLAAELAKATKAEGTTA